MTWVSRASLEVVGARPSGRRRFETTEGRELTRKTGEAVLEIMGERATRLVVLGEPGDAEGLGLEVDPATKALRKAGGSVAYMASRRASHAV